MSKGCTHIAGIRDVTPSALGCEECLKSGSVWLHLRICRTCGHVGCCDDSPNKHATKHFHATQHPIIEGYDPPEGWGWCYVDEVQFVVSTESSRKSGPFPSYYCRLFSIQGNHGRQSVIKMLLAVGLVALAPLSFALLAPLAAFAQAPKHNFAGVNGVRLH